MEMEQVERAFVAKIEGDRIPGWNPSEIGILIQNNLEAPKNREASPIAFPGIPPEVENNAYP
jgi:hypothetical protein